MKHLSVEQLFATHEQLCREAMKIMVAKNHDYRGGSGDPFANFRDSTGLGIKPILGIMLRMRDKQQRIRTFVEKGVLQVKGESVKDAILDQINYLVLMYGMIVEEEQNQSVGCASADGKIHRTAADAAFRESPLEVAFREDHCEGRLGG